MIRTFLLAVLCSIGMSLASAQTKDYMLKVGDFNELTLAANINVNYRHNPDSAGYAVYSCTPQMAHAITFIQNRGKVKIEVISDNPITDALPTVTIYSSGLKKASNMGDSTLCLLSTDPAEKLSVKVIGNGTLKALDVRVTKLTASLETGSGHIFVDGNTQDADLNMAGTGVIEAGNLTAAKTKIWMFGTGSIDCTASEQLSLYGAGSGTVYYAGQPKIKKRNIGIKLVQIE